MSMTGGLGPPGNLFLVSPNQCSRSALQAGCRHLVFMDEKAQCAPIFLSSSVFYQFIHHNRIMLVFLLAPSQRCLVSALRSSQQPEPSCLVSGWPAGPV